MSNTVWFVVPEAMLTSFKGLYIGESVVGRDNPGEPERVGQMIVGKTGNLMTGTTRMSEAARQALLGHKPPWLEIFTTFPPPATWDYPDLL